MKIITRTDDEKLVMVELTPEEMKLVYHGKTPDLMWHKDVTERIIEALDAAEAGAVVEWDLDLTDKERNAIFADAIHFKTAPVRRAKVPGRFIVRK